MRKFLAFMAVVLLVASTGVALAKVGTDFPSTLKATQAPKAGWLDNDVPARALGAAKLDTICFGWYEDRYASTDSAAPYALVGEKWTFDHGSANTFEGWTSVDLSNNLAIYWRPITRLLWNAENNTPPESTFVAWPAMIDSGMVLCGATLQQANLLSWLKGVGYGGGWCQTLTSPDLLYDGSGDVALSMRYFNESEIAYDFTKIYVESGGYGAVPYLKVLLNGPNGWDASEPNGIDSLGVIGAGAVAYATVIPNISINGEGTAQPFRIIIEFKADGGVSDEDGPLDAIYGAVGVDEIGLTGNLAANALYSFNAGTLEGWTAAKCPALGSQMGLADREDEYIVSDPCACSLVDNVLELHDSGNLHPNGQNEELWSPIVDRSGLDVGYNRIMAEWDQYAEMPQANGVFYRPGWSYYPYNNPYIPGLISWSPRIGQDTYYYAGDTPTCYLSRSIGTDWGVPTNAPKVKFIYEINANCASFGITNCSGITNFTPIIDNVKVCNVGFVNAPVALYEPGTRFQDGYGRSALGVLSTTDPGNSDIVYNLRMGQSTVPTKLGDTLMVSGPIPQSINTKWEARMWFRLRRTGPGQASGSNPGLADYNLWKAAVGPNVTYDPLLKRFAWGYMDSVESPTPQRNKFCSFFRENDPAFSWGAGTGEKDPGNEMMPDGVFTPGTKIEYFITTNYTNPDQGFYYYPDTAGAFYSEFEILPSFRTSGGVDKFPCVLYVDAFNAGAQFYIENALNVVLNGAGTGAPIPDPTSWDRYDYMDASSNWNGPLYRMTGATSGMSIPQMLGYKLIMVSLGDASTGSMEARDWQGFDQWLGAVACAGNSNLQGFIVDGTSAAEILKTDAPYTLNTTMGATWVCGSYNTNGCASVGEDNDDNNCVRVEPVNPGGSPFPGPGIPSDVFGNWCPEKQPFNVLGATGTGQGIKKFVKIQAPNYATSFSQVVNDKSAGASNYRSVIESFSYDRLIERGPAGLGECAYADPDTSDKKRVTAAYKEIENAVKWTLNITNPLTQVGLCVDPCGPNPVDVPDAEGAGGAVTRLYQNKPNPFNPRTAIKFSLAADGPTRLIIYDVNGRRIRTLVDQTLKAGTHEQVWDGTDDAGRTVTSGVYWSQLHFGAVSTNKKMVVLK